MLSQAHTSHTLALRVAFRAMPLPVITAPEALAFKGPKAVRKLLLLLLSSSPDTISRRAFGFVHMAQEDEKGGLLS